MSELVEHYRFNLYSIQGKQEGKIVLHCGNGHTLNLVFFADPTGVLPPNTFDAGTKTGTAHASFAMYQHYFNVLRSGPCRASFILDTTPPSFRVQSTLLPLPG